MTEQGLSLLRCMHYSHGKFTQGKSEILNSHPLLEPAYNRGGRIIALFCNVCHHFYIVVDGEPVKYPKRSMPGYKEQLLSKAKKRGSDLHDLTMSYAGEDVALCLLNKEQEWHSLNDICCGRRTARKALQMLVAHGFVSQSMEHHEGSRNKMKVWRLVPTWKQTIPCSHDALCRGFWFGLLGKKLKEQRKG